MCVSVRLDWLVVAEVHTFVAAAVSVWHLSRPQQVVLSSPGKRGGRADGQLGEGCTLSRGCCFLTLISFSTAKGDSLSGEGNWRGDGEGGCTVVTPAVKSC